MSDLKDLTDYQLNLAGLAAEKSEDVNRLTEIQLEKSRRQEELRSPTLTPARLRDEGWWFIAMGGFLVCAAAYSAATGEYIGRSYEVLTGKRESFLSSVILLGLVGLFSLIKGMRLVRENNSKKLHAGFKIAQPSAQAERPRSARPSS